MAHLPDEVDMKLPAAQKMKNNALCYKQFSSSVLVLIDSTSRVLMQLRDARASYYPCRWGFFGGGIEPGETPELALKREAYEELRYHPSDPRLLFVRKWVEHQTSRVCIRHFFADRCLDPAQLVLNEGSDMKWITANDWKSLRVVPYVYETIGEIFKSLGRR